jgi:hypothetical protein
MEVKLKISDLKVSQEYDADMGGLVCTIKFKAKVDVKDVADLAQLQMYTNSDCIISGDSKQLRVDTDTGEIS